MSVAVSCDFGSGCNVSVYDNQGIPIKGDVLAQLASGRLIVTTKYRSEMRGLD